jgi:hypothetical protein
MAHPCRIRSSAFFWVFFLLAFSVGTHAAEKDSPSAKAKYLKELEKFQKAVTLSPIKLEKAALKAGDVIKPTASLVNQTPEELIVPQAPGDPLDARKSMVGRVHWSLRRKDGKPVDPTDDSSVGKKASKPHVLFYGSVALSKLKPGEHHPLPVWDINVTNQNLASGDYEVVLDFTTDEFPFKSLATQVAAFSVDNPNAIPPAQVAQKRKEAQALRLSISRQLMSSLRLGDLSLSNTNVQKGGIITAGCQLRNPTAKDLPIPSEFSKDALTTQWYLTKQPYPNGHREPLGGGLMNLPDENSFGAGKVVEVTCTISTNNLDLGNYEVAVAVTDVANTLIGLRKQKFRVVK